MASKTKYIIALTLYLVVLTASGLTFRHLVYWDIHRAIQMGDQKRVLTLIERKPRCSRPG